MPVAGTPVHGAGAACCTVVANVAPVCAPRTAYRTVLRSVAHLVRLFGDAELATDVEHRHPFAHLNLECAQIGDDRFRGVPLPCHRFLVFWPASLTPSLAGFTGGGSVG